MRILMVATDVKLPGDHGGSTHVGELFAGLSKRAETLLLARADSLGDGIVPLGSALRSGEARRHLDAARLLPRALGIAREFEPDVIYERCSSYGLGALLSVAAQAPLLTMVLDERYSWLSLLRARCLVATQLDLIPAKVRHKGVQVHWGANTERFSANIDMARARSELGFQADEFVVAYAGSFKKWHGLNLLADVAARPESSAMRFLMIGDGPCRQELELLLNRRSLSSRFLFLGSLAYEQVPGRLAAADACVAPFDPEAHAPSKAHGSFVLDPLKVFEYLALNKPTVTIRARNLTAIFEDRNHLLFYDSGDAAGLTRALTWISQHRQEAAAMAERGRELVLRKYTWQAHADHLLELFEGLSK